MPRFDLAGNPLPEPGGSPLPPATPPASAPSQETRRPTGPPPVPSPPPTALVSVRPSAPVPAPAAPVPATSTPAAPFSPQSILTRGVVAETPAQKVRAYAGLIATFVVLILATYAIAAIPPPQVAAPDSYTPYTSADAGFSCDAPADWKQRDREGTILFTRKKVRIEIEAQPLSVGDSASAPGGATSSGPSIDDLDKQGQGMLADELGDAHLQEQTTRPLAAKMGEARLTEWTATAELTHLHGCRATLLGGGEVVSVICRCPERDWDTLKPAFLHVIQSVVPTSPSPNGGQ